MKFNLKTLRLIKGINQQKASEMLNVSISTISSWENGKTYPDAMEIKRIEQLYDTKFEDILF